MLAFAGAFLMVVILAVSWWLWRTTPVRRAVETELRVSRARLTAGLARLGAEVSTLDPGEDPVARRRLAEAAERLATARALVERADTPMEMLAVAVTLVEGTRAANRVRARLGLPKRKLPAVRRHRELARWVQRMDREQSDGKLHTRWWFKPMLFWPWLAGMSVGWYFLIIPPSPPDPAPLGMYFIALLPPAAVTAMTLWVLLTVLLNRIRRSRDKDDVFAERYAQAQALLAQVAARLAEPDAARAPDFEVVSEAYTEALEQLETARTVRDVRLATEEIRSLISAAREPERTG